MNRKILRHTVLLSVITLGLVSCLGGDENIQSSSTASNTASTAQTIQPSQQGLVVAVDPATGELHTPTKAQQQTLRFQEQQLQKTTGSKALKEKILADGTVMIDLQGQFQHQIEVDVIQKESATH
jgi:hypothetical protein